MAAKLWIGSAESPYRNPYGLVVILAETRDEAIVKARKALEAAHPGYVPAQRYKQNLLDHLEQIKEADSDVFIDWTPSERR